MDGLEREERFDLHPVIELERSDTSEPLGNGITHVHEDGRWVRQRSKTLSATWIDSKPGTVSRYRASFARRTDTSMSGEREMSPRERALRQAAAAAGLKSIRAVSRASKLAEHAIHGALRGRNRLARASVEKLSNALHVPPSAVAAIFELDGAEQ